MTKQGKKSTGSTDLEAALDLKSEVSPILTKRLTSVLGFLSHLWAKLLVNIQQLIKSARKNESRLKDFTWEPSVVQKVEGSLIEYGHFQKG